jgi:prevent-host-death family protein
MRTASISELKAHLSRYLREVRRGGEVHVLDRGRPVARLTGLDLDADSGTDHRAALVRAGILRPGTGRVPEFLRRQPIRVETDLRRALDDDRADRV